MTVMNPGGLSTAAEARLAAMSAGAGDDLPMPDVNDLAAIGVWRAAQHDAWGEGAEPGETEHSPTTIAGIDCRVAGPEKAPKVLHLHAGGFSLGSPGTDIPITARLAKHLRVVSVDYRLAPEHPFPAAVEDSLTVYEALTAASGPLGISGISAGGNLAVQVAWHATTAPRAIALMCPHIDFGGGHRPLLPHEAAYLAGHSPGDLAAAPAAADFGRLAALPPMLIQASSAEPMWADIDRFASRAADAGARVTQQTWQDLWHAWHYHRELPEAHHAVDVAADWLVEQLR